MLQEICRAPQFSPSLYIFTTHAYIIYGSQASSLFLHESARKLLFTERSKTSKSSMKAFRNFSFLSNQPRPVQVDASFLNRRWLPLIGGNSSLSNFASSFWELRCCFAFISINVTLDWRSSGNCAISGSSKADVSHVELKKRNKILLLYIAFFSIIFAC